MGQKRWVLQGAGYIAIKAAKPAEICTACVVRGKGDPAFGALLSERKTTEKQTLRETNDKGGLSILNGINKKTYQVLIGSQIVVSDEYLNLWM